VIQSFQEVCCPSSTTLSTDDSDDEDDSFYWPCIVIDHHLGPKELAAIFSYTALNIHPCLYDAYGMTMVESAAFGVPSVVNCGGNVGAAALLGENEGCIALDLSEMEEVIVETMTMTDDRKNDSSSNEKEDEESDCVKKLMELLASRRIMHAAIDRDSRPQQQSCCSTTTTLAKVAKEARRRSLEYDELSCCRGLIDKLNSLKEN
jgi:glycosyltransferase involved in cell wall biosynthesis